MFKSAMSVEMIICSVFSVLIVASLCSAGDELEQAKNRRGGTVGLFAFPRVGRSDPNLLNWEFNPNSYEEYDEEFPNVDLKRSGLVAFPRVGRSEGQLRRWAKIAALQQNLDKRTGSSANSGLWFGPRLGRVQKRSTDSHDQTGDHF